MENEILKSFDAFFNSDMKYYVLGILLLILTISIMFWWENKFRWWLRLPGINLVFFVILLVLGFIEEIYLTFHPNKRTKYINTSIYQVLFG